MNGDSPFLVKIALTQFPTIPLSVIHRTVGSVQVYQRKQSFLDINTGTKRKCTAKQYSNVTGIGFVEYLNFLVYAHPGFHYYNLFLRHTAGY